MEKLNDDLIREIFVHLPRRSLAKSKLVSKSWLKIISSPSFITAYDTRNHSFFNFVHCDNNTKQQLSSQPFCLLSPHNENRKLLDLQITKVLTIKSSNGLILSSVQVMAPGFAPNPRLLLLLNPITTEYRFLPASPLSLSLDQPLTTGFGFNNSSDPLFFIVTEIYSSSVAFDFTLFCLTSIDLTWTWKRVIFNNMFCEHEVLSDGYGLIDGSVFFNEKLHWVIVNGSVLIYDGNRGRCSVIPGPLGSRPVTGRRTEQTHVEASVVHLGESRHRLVYVAIDFGVVNNNNNVYSVSCWSYNGIWVYDYWVQMGLEIPKRPDPYLEVVGICPTEPRMVCLNLGSALYFYDVRTKEMKLIHKYNNDNIIDNDSFYENFNGYRSYCHLIEPRFPPSDPRLYLRALFGK